MTSGSSVLFVTATAVVCATVITAIVVLGPPNQNRELRLDSVRTDNLQALQQSLTRFAAVHHGLPDDLATLAKEPGYRPTLTDPESGANYAYERLSGQRFRICANFDLATDDDADIEARTWAHGAGRQCFERVVATDASASQ